ncbi:MAG: DNA primase [Lachnospiraceae bacterium]|jgi:DNA primase
MYYPQEIIDQIIESNNIVDVISQYVPLKKKGSTYFGLCPFHNEKTPSFSVTDDGSKQMFYCFGCHTGGSVLTFIMKYENYSYTEALKHLADRAGITLPKPDYSGRTSERYRKKEEILAANKDAAIYFYHLLKSERGVTAYNYLKQRGLTDETIRSFGLGFSDKYRDDLYKYLKKKGYSDEILKESGLVSIKETDTHDYFWNRVMFPIMDTSGRVIAFGGRVMGEGEPKYLNSPETVCFEKSRNLYGLNVARKYKGRDMILCEGYMDVIALHQAGFTNAVATLGTVFNDNHASVLKRYTQNIIISFDSDGAGQDAALRALPRLKGAGINVKIADLSPYKDPDELIKALGAEEFKRRLQMAVNGFLFEIFVLQKSFNLEDPDEKTRFGNELASRLSYMGDELERENYLRVICEKFDFSYEIMNSKVRSLAMSHDGIKYIKNDLTGNRQKLPKASDGLIQSQKLLLAYIAGEPSFYDNISGVIRSSDFASEPYATIADILLKQLASGKVNPAGIISAFEEEEEQEQAAQILYHEFGDVSDEDKKKALNDCVKRLKRHHIDTMLEEESDPARMIELGQMKESLNKLNIFEVNYNG